MSLTSSQIAVFLIAALHVAFMIGELYPWESPFIMAMVVEKWPQPLKLPGNDSHFVSLVVHNAGIYNGIVAIGLFAAASMGRTGFPVQVALLTGGIVAGLFGAATLTKATILQAVAGAIALAWVVYHP
jgi:putative membrane protein